MRTIRKLSFLGILAVAIAVLFLVSISFVQAQATTRGKPEKPVKPDKPGEEEVTWAVQIPGESWNLKGMQNADESPYIYANNNDDIIVSVERKGWKTVGKGGASGGAKLVEDYGLANTIIELRSSSEIRRTVTDNQGRFEFEELRPGKWTLKINSENLPEYHYLEKDTFELELKPGQRVEISAKVLPKKRRIQIIAEPKTLLEEEQK